MTLRVLISHANPGYPVRAMVVARSAGGYPSYEHATPVGDGESVEKYVHAGQWIKIYEEGHLDNDLNAAAERTYDTYCRKLQELGTPTLPWSSLTHNARDAWRAVAEAFA